MRRLNDILNRYAFRNSERSERTYDLTHIALTKISSKTDADFITPFMRMIVDGCKPFTAQCSLTILISCYLPI